jgi:hypothetical protein
VTWPQGKKFPPKKYCYEEFFASMQSLKDMDNVLDFCAEEVLAALFQPDTVAPAEYLKIHERKPGLGPRKKTYARGAGRCHRLLPKLCLCNGQPAEEMVSGSGGMV